MKIDIGLCVLDDYRRGRGLRRRGEEMLLEGSECLIYMVQEGLTDKC